MIVVVPADPPRDGLVLPALAERTPLATAEVARLYEAALADVCRAVQASGGELLVNYRDERTIPDEYLDEDRDDADPGTDPEAEVRAIVADALGGTDDVRFERQVGSSRAARVGNTVTHVLEREDARSVGVLEPTAALVTRTEIDGAAMSLRRSGVVLGPATAGRTYVAGFAEPIDFTDAYATPALATLATRGADADLGVDFAPMLPTLATPEGVGSTIAGITARAAAGRPIPEATTTAIDELGLTVTDDEPGIGRLG